MVGCEAERKLYYDFFDFWFRTSRKLINAQDYEEIRKNIESP